MDTNANSTIKRAVEWQPPPFDVQNRIKELRTGIGFYVFPKFDARSFSGEMSSLVYLSSSSRRS
jgi:hypothetical protein